MPKISRCKRGATAKPRKKPAASRTVGTRKSGQRRRPIENKNSGTQANFVIRLAKESKLRTKCGKQRVRQCRDRQALVDSYVSRLCRKYRHVSSTHDEATEPNSPCQLPSPESTSEVEELLLILSDSFTHDDCMLYRFAIVASCNVTLILDLLIVKHLQK